MPAERLRARERAMTGTDAAIPEGDDARARCPFFEPPPRPLGTPACLAAARAVGWSRSARTSIPQSYAEHWCRTQKYAQCSWFLDAHARGLAVTETADLGEADNADRRTTAETWSGRARCGVRPGTVAGIITTGAFLLLVVAFFQTIAVRGPRAITVPYLSTPSLPPVSAIGTPAASSEAALSSNVSAVPTVAGSTASIPQASPVVTRRPEPTPTATATQALAASPAEPPQFSFTIPPGWEQITPQDALVRSQFRSGTPPGVFNVATEPVATVVTLDEYVHSTIARIIQSNPSYRLGPDGPQPASLGGFPAERYTFDTMQQGITINVIQYAMIENGVAFVLTFLMRVEDNASLADTITTVISTFTVLPR